jgi:hypothetical protein
MSVNRRLFHKTPVLGISLLRFGLCFWAFFRGQAVDREDGNESTGSDSFRFSLSEKGLALGFTTSADEVAHALEAIIADGDEAVLQPHLSESVFPIRAVEERAANQR